LNLGVGSAQGREPGAIAFKRGPHLIDFANLITGVFPDDPAAPTADYQTFGGPAS
jgi:hypothetical protein